MISTWRHYIRRSACVEHEMLPNDAIVVANGLLWVFALSNFASTSSFCYCSHWLIHYLCLACTRVTPNGRTLENEKSGVWTRMPSAFCFNSIVLLLFPLTGTLPLSCMHSCNPQRTNFKKRKVWSVNSYA